MTTPNFLTKNLSNDLNLKIISEQYNTSDLSTDRITYYGISILAESIGDILYRGFDVLFSVFYVGYSE